MSLKFNSAWRDYRWVELKDGERGVSIELNLRPPKFTDRLRFESSDGDELAAAYARILKDCVRDWRDVTDENGKEIPFKLEALEEVLGAHPTLANRLAAEIGSAVLRDDDSKENPTTSG